MHYVGERAVVPDAGISSKDGRRWLEGWAFFHEIAAKHGGYHVR